MNNINTIFKLTRYVFFTREKLRKYPTLRLHEDASYHYLSLDDAENKIRDNVEVEQSCSNHHKTVYAYVIIEIPIDKPYRGHRDRFRDPHVLLETIYSPIVVTLYGLTPVVPNFLDEPSTKEK